MIAKARLIAALPVIWIAALGLIGCGSGRGSATIARVGGSAITEATLSRSMAQLAPEHAVPDPPHYRKCIRREEAETLLSLKAELTAECMRQYRVLRQQALNSLISSHWVIGEAVEKGLVHGDRGATLQARAERASASIRDALFSAEPQIAAAQVALQYRREIAHFRIPERRGFEIFEHIPTEAEARKLRAQILGGHRNVDVVHLHEWLARPSSLDVGGAKGPITKAIFAARLRALSTPVPLDGQYALIELTKITSPGTHPLAQVEKSIRDRLAREQRQRTLARFIAGWRARWRAKTDCAAGYVVQKCRQYFGPRSREDPLVLK
jgi:hypothetical protein